MGVSSSISKRLKMHQNIILLFVSVLLPSEIFTNDYCTGEFSCNVNDLYSQEHGVYEEKNCQEICSADGRCQAYTFWMSTALTHWNQCWLFSTCEKIPCQECLSGTLGGCETNSTTSASTSTGTTTTAGTTTAGTTVPGKGCPPLNEDQVNSMTCFPDTVPGQEVVDGSHCIWQCGEDTSLHTCAGGLWDVPLPTACLCPPLPEVGGEYLCVPPLLESGEAEDETYCILTCGDVPSLEIQCDLGSWSKNLDDITC